MVVHGSRVRHEVVGPGGGGAVGAVGAAARGGHRCIEVC